ncbi:hypothetical protein QCA50_003158 [Cerrena zonata]|uniref:Anaphase-promoting complex subunit 5 n=1 Tax=Cerrena zonata TaxID=2478898 RepID=A0AAW0GRB2_9APHY
MNQQRPAPTNGRAVQAMPPPLPPTNFVLLPHHLQLLRLISLVLNDYDDRDVPHSFIIYIYRLLLVEIMNVRQPATFQQLVAALEEGAVTSSMEAEDLIMAFKTTHTDITSPNRLRVFFQDVTMLVVVNDEDDDNTPLARRSLFGYFCRRCFLSYLKLSHEALNLLFRDYHDWIAGTLDEKTLYIKKDLLDMTYNLHQTRPDKKGFAQPDEYALFEKELATGDTKSASDRLRGFFEQYFHEGTDSGLRHIAILNLARMHYLNHEYPICRKLLKEAISVARNCGDMLSVQQCSALLHRLPVESGQKPPINEIQFFLHPLELLSDVKKLLQVGNNQPLSASFEKIAQAVSLFDTWHDFHRGFVTDSEQWAQHAVQSSVWSSAGCAKLADIEESVVLAFTDPGSNDNNRLTVTVNKAYRHARQGKYKEAIAMLLRPDVFTGLTLNDYNTWASEIWHILVLRASRRGQERMFHDFLKPKQPGNVFSQKEYWFDAQGSIGSTIRDPLYEVLSMRQCDQAHRLIEPLLKALWHTEFLQRYGTYRVALVMLADIGLEYGMTKWSRRIIDEIMPQVINGDDLELRACTSVTLARCIIASEDPTSEPLREALNHLRRAERDYRAIEALRPLQDVHFLISVVCHNLENESERDMAARECHAIQKQREELDGVVMEQWIADVWDIVTKVGAGLAAR